jgi:hypothetical protein
MTIGLDWISNRDAWEALVVEAGRSTLPQSWAWGEAKAEIEGWRPRRAVLADGARVVAACQVLEKRLGPLRLARINRGPLWLAADLGSEGKATCLATLARPWRWYGGRAQLIAPELAEGDRALATSLGWRHRASPAWGSAWIDLAAEPDLLRKRLNGKWRNMLVNAEKAGLEVDIRHGAEGLGWLLPRYQTMMAEKGFGGIAPPLLEALARHADAADLTLLTARAGADDASAVLVYRHGAAATYLIGWNSLSGRNTRANHLLLWRALLAMKEGGCRWFDLGGIDAALTPGIAAFKRGLGGEEYRLAGEFLSW